MLLHVRPNMVMKVCRDPFLLHGLAVERDTQDIEAAILRAQKLHACKAFLRGYGGLEGARENPLSRGTLARLHLYLHMQHKHGDVSHCRIVESEKPVQRGPVRFLFSSVIM